jgi:hypothetical protein
VISSATTVATSHDRFGLSHAGTGWWCASRRVHFANLATDSDDRWVVDSGASSHMCRDKEPVHAVRSMSG